MLNPETAVVAAPPSVTAGIVERTEHGMVVLAPAQGKPFRRVLFVNCYGGRVVWDRIKNGLMPPHHLWGCLELARMGYEVALAEGLPDFYLYRNPLPHDLRLFGAARSWLGRDGVLYCGHNVLYWLPFLKRIWGVRCRMVSLLYAREPLDFATTHDGIIGLNPAATDHARQLAPRARVVHLGWGADLRFFPNLPYDPQWFLSCGKTLRDHHTLSLAAQECQKPLRLISPQVAPELKWPPSVSLTTGGQTDDTVSYADLLNDYYRRCAASLIILTEDRQEYTGVGFTNLIEAMAMARPVIVTRTGALPSGIDVEAEGCGLHVPPKDPAALARAMETIFAEPERAEAMGRKGRTLCEQHYNIDRYAAELHQFFQAL